MAAPAPPPAASSSSASHSDAQQRNNTKSETSKITFQHPMETKSAVNVSYTTQSDDTFQVQISPAMPQETKPSSSSSAATAIQPTSTTTGQRQSWFSSLFSRRARKTDTPTAGR